jgi:hypothetical protein
MSGVSCYVYYRIAPEHAARAREALAAVLATLEQRHGVIGRLLRGAGEPLLWMEVYENLHDDERVLADLEGLLAERRFDALLAPGSARRTERFVAQA